MRLKKITISIYLFIAVFFLDCFKAFPQNKVSAAANFKRVVENKLKKIYGTSLNKVCPIEIDATAKRIFSEYGAVFVADKAVKLPPKCIFSSEAELQDYQVRANPRTVTIGSVEIILQKPALEALLKAQQEAALKNLRISPRGGSLAAKRSLKDTITLWDSRLYPGLIYWIGQRKISEQEANQSEQLEVREQIAKVLEWENKGWFFSRDLTKSILYSVAAPGTSQHNFMLALDVEQFADEEVRKILAENGWFQTVKSDLPHFTYLGVKEKQLLKLGLKSVIFSNQKFWIPNI